MSKHCSAEFYIETL